jgi:hypothetical protein
LRRVQDEEENGPVAARQISSEEALSAAAIAAASRFQLAVSWRSRFRPAAVSV